MKNFHANVEISQSVVFAYKADWLPYNKICMLIIILVVRISDFLWYMVCMIVIPPQVARFCVVSSWYLAPLAVLSPQVYTPPHTNYGCTWGYVKKVIEKV